MTYVTLSCGCHEASRLIPCPVCPRVLAELREEAAEVRAFVVGTSSATGNAPRGRRRKANAPEIVRRAQEGQSARQIANAMGISEDTARTYGKGHFHAPKRIDREEVIRRAKRGESAPVIARAMGCGESTVQALARGVLVRKRPARKAPPKAPGVAERVAAALRRGWSVKTVATRCGVAPRTVRGVRTKMLRRAV
jgi:DNA-binding NarL/FixJ family response regulator